MTTPDYWATACTELSKEDPTMRRVILAYKGETLKSRKSAFETLLRAIVSQQISVKAAETIWNRLVEAAGGIDVDRVLACRQEKLRKAGLSERKTEYVRDLATKFQSKEVNPRRWHSLDDETVILELTAVRGIGRWTAEMFLIFHLLRPNVFPKDDLGLHKALSKNYGVRYPVSERSLVKFQKQFHPWASVATWYLWRSLDPIAVEY